MGQESLAPSSFFISFVIVPLNSLLWYVPSSRYIWSSASILFLSEQIKDNIIFCVVPPPTYVHTSRCFQTAT